MEGFKKGQAAMEYLMTYGWALLVIVVVIAALFFLTQGMFKMESCKFNPVGFSCGDTNPQIYVDATNNVKMSIRVYNQFEQGVDVHNAVCTTGSLAEISSKYKGWQAKYTTAMQKNADGTVTSLGTEGIGAGTSKVFVAECVDAEGAALTMTPNSQFKGSYIIWYNYKNDPDKNVYRQAVGSIAGPVLQ